jgi:DNA polymerase III delta subunit
MCVLDPDLPPWDLTDALGARDAASTLEVLGRFLDQRDADVARVLPSLARHLRQLHATSLLLDQGAGADAVAKALGLRSAFPARKLCQQASRWSREELAAALARVALIEAETRGESVLPDRFSLELGLGEALAAARR